MMIKKIFDDRVLLLFPEVKSESDTGIYLPKDPAPGAAIAEVVMVGDACYKVKAGDKVLLGNSRGSECSHNGRPHVIVLERNIEAIVVNEAQNDNDNQ